MTTPADRRDMQIEENYLTQRISESARHLAALIVVGSRTGDKPTWQILIEKWEREASKKSGR